MRPSLNSLVSLIVVLTLAALETGCASDPPEPYLLVEAPLGQPQWGEPMNGLQVGLDVRERWTPKGPDVWLHLRNVGQDELRVMEPSQGEPGYNRALWLVFDLSNGDRYLVRYDQRTSPPRIHVVNDNRLSRWDGSDPTTRPNSRTKEASDARVYVLAKGGHEEAPFSINPTWLKLSSPVEGELTVVYSHQEPKQTAWGNSIWTGEAATRPIRFRYVVPE